MPYKVDLGSSRWPRSPEWRLAIGAAHPTCFATSLADMSPEASMARAALS
jgi:hypothetical protein